MSTPNTINKNISISTKQANPNRTINSESKNYWCRNYYWKVIQSELGRNPFKETHGCTLKECQNDSKTCIGMHSEDEFILLPHIESFNKLDKAKYDWIKMFLALNLSIKQDITKANNPEHLKKFEKIDQMNFIEVIQFWRELACYYRRIAKRLKEKETTNIIQSANRTKQSDLTETTYMLSKEVPKFELPHEMEDTAWAFERVTKKCEDYDKFKYSINNFKLITIWDVCCCHDNCRDGVHNPSHQLCTEDFLNGKCSCPTVRELETKEIEYQTKLIELSNQLVEIIELEKQEKLEGGWSKPKSKGRRPHQDPKTQIQNQIIDLQKKIDDLQNSRPIHFTELGMEPFEKVWKNWTEEQGKLKEQRRAEQAANEARKAAEREAAEKEAAEKAKNAKPIVKLIKPGSKKP